MRAANRSAGAGPWEPGSGREVWEEAGIRVEVDQLRGVYKNTSRGVVAMAFRCKPSGGTERTSDESTAVEWLTPEQITERMSEIYAIRLLDALDEAGPPRPEPRRQAPAPSAVELSLLHQGGARSARRALPGSPPGPDAPAFGPLWPRLRRSRGWSEHHGGEKPAVAGAVGSTALATSPVRAPRRARPGGHSFKFRAGSQPARVAGQRTVP